MNSSTRKKLINAEHYTPILPAAAMMVLFLLGPIIWSLYASLTDYSMVGSTAVNPHFVGLKNYVALFTDPVFPKSLWLTILLILASALIGQNILGMVLALLSQKAPRRLTKVVDSIVVLAWVIPDIVGCYCAYALFAGGGTLDALGKAVGADWSALLYYHPMTIVIIVNVWRGTAFSMLIYQAALNDISMDVIEAAEIDGANAWQSFFRIKLPIMRHSILTNLMLITLQTLSVFSIIIVLTGGGPGTNSSTLPVLAYLEAFNFSKLGYGTAISVILVIVGALFSVLYIKLLRTNDED